MPLYEYECSQCGCFELIRKFSDPVLTDCPTCGKPVQKLLSAPAIQFKGAGWYVTDYAGKGSRDKSEGKKADKDGASKEAASKDSASGPAKSDSAKTGTGDTKS
jgi:putative FmdB family regulatory protein